MRRSLGSMRIRKRFGGFYIKRYRRRGFARTMLFRLLCVLLCAAIATLSLDAKIRPIIRSMASYQIETHTTMAINNAVMKVMEDSGLGYDDFVLIEKDADMRITAVKSNTSKMNELRAQISTTTAQCISDIEKKQISIPVGTLIGSDVFTGRGPRLKFYVSVSSAVLTDVRNEFEAAGINQTHHRVILDITAKTYAYIPMNRLGVEVKTSVTIAETIIVGVVPELFAELSK
ncbi:MAG: sporulation protein YunB [Clostridiales bacterium]|nr:sporulation protein YunB [Clostridiales bacterium]